MVKLNGAIVAKIIGESVEYTRHIFIRQNASMKSIEDIMRVILGQLAKKKKTDANIPLLSVAEASQITGKTVGAIYKSIRQRKLHSYQYGDKRNLVSEKEVIHLYADKETNV